MLQKANEPLLLIRQLRKLGGLERRGRQLPRLPPLDAIEPEAAYLSWVFELDTGVPQSAIHEVFEFVEDDCDLTIEDISIRAVAAPVAGRGQIRSPRPRNRPADASGVPPPTPTQSIRVDVDKVDRLVNLVGELVITQAMLTEQGTLLPADQYPALIQGIEALAQSARELQESVMAIRAQPVKSVFARMPRMVRDLAATLGKEVRIVTAGEMHRDRQDRHRATDRSADPHDPQRARPRHRRPRTRASPPASRARAPSTCRPRSAAAASSSRLPTTAAASIARRCWPRPRIADWWRRAQSLSDEEIDNLIFLPAFSTADVVSNISGRGVGMDVVKRNVQSLGGRITVQSRFGAGSRFTLSLPLTLAVLDGMVVSVGKETFIIPLTAIIESLRPQAADIHPVVGRGDVLALRGEYVPLIHLHRCFAIEDAITDPCRGIVIIVRERKRRPCRRDGRRASGPAAGRGEEPGSQLRPGRRHQRRHHPGQRPGGADPRRRAACARSTAGRDAESRADRQPKLQHVQQSMSREETTHAA